MFNPPAAFRKFRSGQHDVGRREGIAIDRRGTSTVFADRLEAGIPKSREKGGPARSIGCRRDRGIVLEGSPDDASHQLARANTCSLWGAPSRRGLGSRGRPGHRGAKPRAMPRQCRGRIGMFSMRRPERSKNATAGTLALYRWAEHAIEPWRQEKQATCWLPPRGGPRGVYRGGGPSFQPGRQKNTRKKAINHVLGQGTIWRRHRRVCGSINMPERRAGAFSRVAGD